MPSISIDVLGPQVVRKDGKELPPPAPQQRRVLSLLASRPGEVVSREWLASQMWGSASQSQIRGLQSYVSHLRTALGAKAIELISNGYRLAISPDAVDEVRFRQFLQDGNAALAQARYRDAITALTAGLELWRGEPYPDLPRGDFAARRFGLIESKLAAEDALMRARIEMVRDTHEAESLLPDSAEFYAQEPRREGRVIQHMRCLSLAGRTSDVAAVAQDYRTRLRSQGGTDSAADFSDMVTLLLRRDPKTLPLSWGSRVVLPYYSTPLVCREQEMAVAVSLLRSASTRLLTITGAQGSGKTRLAMAVAEALGPELPGGVIWLETAQATGQGGIVEALSAEMGLRQAGQELRMALPRELGRRRTLVVLDGIGGSDALKDVAVLLAAGPRLSIMATSPGPLGLASEHTLDLHPYAQAVSHPASAAKFVQRLLEGMGVTSPPTLSEIQEHLTGSDGFPQGLEQVALDLVLRGRTPRAS